MRTSYLLHRFTIVFFAAAIFLLQGCVKDKCTSRYTYWEPVYKTKAEARAEIKNGAPTPIERPGKIYIRGNYIFLNEIDKGVHIIDNTNPASPQNIAFVNIPGNMDMAVKGNMLYADFFTDLAAVDISNPQNVVLTKVTENVFPERTWNAQFTAVNDMVIVDWKKKDTVVSMECGGNDRLWTMEKRSDIMFMNNAAQSSGGGGSPFGVGGSMARFTIVGNYMYAVSTTALNVVSISNPREPVFNNRVQVGFGIETLYPFSDKLFVGSTTGMFIFDINNPVSPTRLGSFTHARSCDPVVADHDYAYVTLRSGNFCAGNSDQLDVLDIRNLNSPTLVKSYQLKNPHGLSKDGNLLIICDGTDGLKFYDAANPSAVQLRKTIAGIETYDVIAINGWALVVAKDGLYQYDYSNLSNITQISKLGINR